MNQTEHTHSYWRIVIATIDHLRLAITEYLPESVERDFLLWLYSDLDPQEEKYIQITGISKIVEMEMAQISNLFDKSFLLSDKIAFYLGALNAYFVTEVVSDNLAIGLANPKKKDSNWKLQRDILLHFNDTMIKKIAGDPNSEFDLLKPYRKQIDAVSSYVQSLTPSDNLYFVELYMKFQRQSPSVIGKLEHDIFIYLVLNIVLCIKLISMVKDHPLYFLLKKELSERYVAVNKLIDNHNKPLSREQLIYYGTKSILIIPTLAYIIAVFDINNPIPNLVQAIESGLLEKALTDVSCCIRILNDMQGVLELSENDIKTLYSKLMDLYQQQKNGQHFKSVLELLESLAESDQMIYHLFLIRLYKDIKYHEFNICLDNLIHIKNIQDGINKFFDNVKFFTNFYNQKYNELLTTLNKIDAILGDQTISKLILSNLEFQKKLYLKELHYGGDFAVNLNEDQ